MKKLICECCGAPINRERQMCEYCGTQYKITDDLIPIRIETYQNPVMTYKSQLRIHDYDIKKYPDEISKIAVDELAHNLADAFKENMDLHTEYDPITMEQVVTARIRVVRPDYIF